MSWFYDRKRILLTLAGCLFVLIYLIFVDPRLKVPPVETHNYYIFGGNVARALVKEGHTSSQTGKPGLPRLPHHLEFKSSNGPIEVYVRDLSNLDSHAQVTEMLKQTEELKAGKLPREYYAKGEGNSGNIPLHSWPYGTVLYYVFIHAQQDTEVVLNVHYAP